MSELHHDPRQWLIYEEGPVTAGIQAIEVLGLITAGTVLKDAQQVEVRAMANLMLRWADARTRTMQADSAEDQAAIQHAIDIVAWMSEGADPDERPEEALTELHSCAFSFDSKLTGAGITGDGWFRQLARGEHGR